MLDSHLSHLHVRDHFDKLPSMGSSQYFRYSIFNNLNMPFRRTLVTCVMEKSIAIYVKKRGKKIIVKNKRKFTQKMIFGNTKDTERVFVTGAPKKNDDCVYTCGKDFPQKRKTNL